MPVKEITVQYVNYPKPGQKKGSIKSSEGDYYGGYPPTLTGFTKGEVCTIEYTETTGQDGRLWKNINKKIGGAPSGKQQQVIPQLRAATNPTDAEQMFVVALLKETTTPTDSLDILKARGKQYKQLYQYLFGTAEQQKHKSTIDDEIPDGPPDYPEEGNWEPER